MKTRNKVLWSTTFVLLFAVVVHSPAARAEASDNVGSSRWSLTTRWTTRDVELPNKSVLLRKSARLGSPQVSASLGFDLNLDAFSFANWAKRPGERALDTAAMIELFGSYQVCRGASPIDCELNEAAERMQERLEDGLTGGHCEGMVVAAGLNYLSRMDGADSLYSGDRAALAPSIAKLWATQLDPDVQLASAGSKMQSLSDLAKSIFASIERRDVATMGVYSTDFAHALLPISATWMDSVLLVGVYDPNVPGEERFLSIDTANDSWSYETYVHRIGVLERVSGQGVGGLDLVPIETRSLPLNVGLG